ncbi:MAG: hypothetical protein IPO15_14140 [Anaerolineae bacterium]|uniref:RNA polymerase sigma factor n=1 Tax=Candidatus Amarolinea dominans TaxID=3140696 RepID=UPI0031368C44|nr:hypothetical protein [Anaerolineae bacterium]
MVQRHHHQRENSLAWPQVAEVDVKPGTVHHAGTFRALEELFERLYVQYHRQLFSYVLRLVGHWEQAEDLTQETFLVTPTMPWRACRPIPITAPGCIVSLPIPATMHCAANA